MSGGLTASDATDTRDHGFLEMESGYRYKILWEALLEVKEEKDIRHTYV